mgnify:FL=1
MQFKKKKINMDLDWQELSFTEYASGIEVFHASLFFYNDKKVQKKILDHALDEYRHSKYFYNLFINQRNPLMVSSAHALVNYGGLSKSPFPCSKEKLLAICAYLYVGEIRAIEFGRKVKDSCKNENIISIFNIIEKDEKNHASGLKKFLEKENKFLVFKAINLAKFKYFFADKITLNLVIKVQIKLETFFTRVIFKYFPQSIFEIKSTAKDFDSVFGNKNRMS